MITQIFALQEAGHETKEIRELVDEEKSLVVCVCHCQPHYTNCEVDNALCVTANFTIPTNTCFLSCLLHSNFVAPRYSTFAKPQNPTIK